MNLPQATLNALISQCRGEIAALETYDRAIKKFAGQPEEPTLVDIREEHDDSVSELRDVIEKYGGKIPHESGAWGSVANVVQNLTALVNDEVPLQVLQQGEQVGIDGYVKLLTDPDVGEYREMLAGQLARCRRHHARLQELRDHILETPTRPMTAW